MDFLHADFSLKVVAVKWSDVISLCRNHDFFSYGVLFHFTLSDVNLLFWNLNFPVAFQASMCLWDPSHLLESYQQPSAWCLFDITDFPISFPISSLSSLNNAGRPDLGMYFFSYHLCFSLWGFLFSVFFSMEFRLYCVTCKSNWSQTSFSTILPSFSKKYEFLPKFL